MILTSELFRVMFPKVVAQRMPQCKGILAIFASSNLDQWKVDPFAREDYKASKPFLEESSFATLFPKYREKYLREVWSAVTQALDVHVCFLLFPLPFIC